MKPTIVVAALSAAAVLGYAAYRLTLDPADETTADTETGAGAAFAERLPDFSLDSLDGQPTAIEDLAGRPLLINFWATWCAPCLREIPLLKAFQERQPDLGVVGIAVDRLEPVISFADEAAFNYPILVGQTDAMEAAAAFGVKVFALPFTVFAAADGSILGIHTGEIHAEHLENFEAVIADLASGATNLETARARIAGTM
jgi:thiol-disulfide isomerase/thioredoxin